MTTRHEETLTLHDLEQRAKEELREWIEDDPSLEPTDLVYEVADSHVPIYNYDLLEVAHHDLWLAVEEPELHARGEKTAIGAIAGNIYEHLTMKLHEYLEDLKRTAHGSTVGGGPDD